MSECKDTSLKNWIKKYDNGDFNNPDTDVQIKAGWWDWFCNDNSLFPRLKRLAPKVKKIAQSPRVQAYGLDNVYVFFKNNCPMYGKLYDSFSICDRKTGDVLFWVAPSLGYKTPELHGKASVSGRNEKNEFVEFVPAGTWKDVLTWFNTATN